MSRERDIRNEIHDLLMATGAFDDVWITGLPEDSGAPASDIRAAALDPVFTYYTTGWQNQDEGPFCWTAQLNVTLLVRHNDQQLRDERCEQLLSILHNTIDGQSLAGFTIPDRTYVKTARWVKPKAPERRITALLWFDYLTFGEFDETE